MNIICPYNISVVLSLTENNFISSELETELILLGHPTLDIHHISLVGRFSDILKAKFPKQTKPRSLYVPIFSNGKVEIQEKTRTTCSYGHPIDSLESICTMEEILDGFAFILPDTIDNGLLLTKYNCHCSGNTLEVVKGKTLEIKYEIPLTLSMPLNSDEIKEFFNGTQCISFDDELKKNIYNSFCSLPGFMEIWKDLYQIFQSNSRAEYMVLENFTSSLKFLEYRYYESTKEFYFLAERYIKSNCIDKIFKENPAYSGKPYPESESVYILSDISQEILSSHRRTEELSEVLCDMEQNSKIGVDGIKLIKEFLDLIDNHGYSASIFLSRWNIYEVFHKTLTLFDIPVQKLIDRIIEAMFLENIDCYNYMEMLQKLHRLSKGLGINISEIPKNAISLLKQLSSQYEKINDIDIKKKWGRVSLVNDSLLFDIPEDKYTITTPKTPEEMIRETISINSYIDFDIDKYLNEKSKIFFVKPKNDVNSHNTIVELDKNNNLLRIFSTTPFSWGVSVSTLSSTLEGAFPSNEISDFINTWLSTIRKDNV